MNLYEELRQIPFVRLTAALLAGIAWQASGWGLGFPALYPALVFAAAYFALRNIARLKTYSRQWITGCAGLLCLFFAGAAVMQQQPSGTSLPLDEPVWLQAEVCDNPLHYDRYTKVQAIVQHYATAGDTATVHEKIILYLAADTSQPSPVAGATLFVNARLSLIPPPGNPDEFNYKQYLVEHKIFVSTYVKQGNYFIDNNLSLWQSVRYAPVHWQQRGLDIFANSPIGEKEYAVIAALALGNKQWLDDDLRNTYISAGAMHILAVSGLHVGIIMVVLSFVFSFLDKRKRGVLIKNILVIICLWLYAAVVGFSPSVTRAAVMFSFVLAGATMRRKLSIYNSLAASAFFIAWFNPQVIFAAGFQLSYCAVLGIVYFQPRIAQRLYLKNKFLNGIWQLATVSFAAQLGTVPVSLLNFHLFPNYFLLTNICIISLTGFIIYGGVAFLAVHQIPFVSTIVGYALQAMLWLLNHIVALIESLPYSTVNNIYINHWQAGLLMAVILCIAVYVSVPRRQWLWAAAYSLAAIVGIHSLHTMQRDEQKMMIVYKVKNASYIEFIDGVRSIALRDTGHIAENYAFNTGNFLIKHGLAAHEKTVDLDVVRRDTLVGNVYCYNGFVMFGNELYKILDNETIDKRLPSIDPDYLIVTGTAGVRPDAALRRYAPKQIIVDASVSPYRARQWAQAAIAQNIPLHNVRDEGAFVKLINDSW
jgi:competence protein ComEC